jgi:hypothetical protein
MESAFFGEQGLNGSTHLYRRGYGTQMNGGSTKLRKLWQSQDHIHYTCKSDKVVVERDGWRVELSRRRLEIINGK